LETRTHTRARRGWQRESGWQPQIAAKAGWPLLIDNETQSHYNSVNVGLNCQHVNAEFEESSEINLAADETYSQKWAVAREGLPMKHPHSAPKRGCVEPSTTAQTTRPLPRNITSTDLLQGDSEITISHNGEIYRLRLTRNGKLILQK
jgi:hemin uptake protein HemP